MWKTSQFECDFYLRLTIIENFRLLSLIIDLKGAKDINHYEIISYFTSYRSVPMT